MQPYDDKSKHHNNKNPPGRPAMFTKLKTQSTLLNINFVDINVSHECRLVI